MKKTEQYYFTGCRQLELGINELNRPSGDVVSIAACRHAKNAIVNFLKYFISLNRETIFNHSSLDDLIVTCNNMDKQLANQPWHFMICKKGQGEEYCLSLEKIKNCIRIAAEMKEIIRKQSNISKN